MFTKSEKNLIELQLRQLARLLETKKLSFRDSFCVIFSDYPTAEFLHEVTSCSIEITAEMHITLVKEMYKIIREGRN